MVNSYGKCRNEVKICGMVKRYFYFLSFCLIFCEFIYLMRLYFEFGDKFECCILKLDFKLKKFIFCKKVMEDYLIVNCFNLEILLLLLD